MNLPEFSIRKCKSEEVDQRLIRYILHCISDLKQYKRIVFAKLIQMFRFCLYHMWGNIRNHMEILKLALIWRSQMYSNTSTYVHTYSCDQALVEWRVAHYVSYQLSAKTSTRKRSIYSTHESCMLSYWLTMERVGWRCLASRPDIIVLGTLE